MANWSWRNKLPSAHDFRSDARARNETERIVCVMNPRAAAGRSGARLGELKRALDRAFAQAEVWKTEGPGHASELAARAIAEGADIVAAVGGDGTCNEVVNGFFEDGKLRSRSSIFTVIPFGTGSDLSRSVRAPTELADALWVAATGMTLPTDVGHIRFVGHDGAPGERVFINVAGFGANGDVVHRANSADKRLGGKATFIQATLGSLLNFEPPKVEVEWDGPDGPGRWSGSLLSAFVANGAYCGGGMNVGSGGSMHDGAFDLTLLPTKGRVRNVAESWRLYDGTVWKVAGSRRVYASSLRARSLDGQAVLLDVDGEQPGLLEAEFRCLERVLQVRGGWLKSPLLRGQREIWRPRRR
jgi:diacylglycerol kinase (ATP)